MKGLSLLLATLLMINLPRMCRFVRDGEAEHAKELTKLTVDSRPNRDRGVIEFMSFITPLFLLLSAVSFVLFGFSFCVKKFAGRNTSEGRI